MILVGFFVFRILVDIYRAIRMYRRQQHTGMNFQNTYYHTAKHVGIIVLSYILCIFFGEMFTFIVLLPVFFLILIDLGLNEWINFSSYLPQPEPDPNAPRMPIQRAEP